MLKNIKYFFKNRKSAKRKMQLGPYAKGVIYDSENGMIAMPTEDITIGKALGFKGNWDIDQIETISKLIKEDDVIYIVGTHVGTLLVPLAKKAREIVGYEANQNTFGFVQMNLCLNQLTNVKLFNNAVGNEEKTVTFYQNTVNTGGSKIKPVKDTLRYIYDSPKEVEVQMIALDTHIDSQGLPIPQGLIMDIEGAEYFALQGMQKTLQNLRFLYMEYVPHHLLNVSNVTVEDFIAHIHPHFNSARFLNDDKTISIENNPDALIDYLNKLASHNTSDDILFSK